jgi:hypothetical protein
MGMDGMTNAAFYRGIICFGGRFLLPGAYVQKPGIRNGNWMIVG